jgi:endonuclease III
MEPHKDLGDISKYKPDLNDGPDKYFKKAYEFTTTFYQDVIDQISSVKIENVTPDFFFREYVFVVHATGFSAKAVGKFMPKLLTAYGSWDICGQKPFDEMMEEVKNVCNNPQKAKAVHSTSKNMVSELREIDWEEWKLKNISTVDKINEFPYIGKITRYHLGRNVGLLECVKPDLHLVRMAEHWGFKNCEDMCRSMRGTDSIPLGIVDLALWYSSSTYGTLDIKKPGRR